MKDYARNRTVGYTGVMTVKFAQDMIREACAEAYSDGQKAADRRAARICRREPQWFYNADCCASVVNQILHRPATKKGAGR